MDWENERAVGWPHRRVAGVDEAGRGAWAGPVIAAAVMLPPDFDPAGLDDSKKLTAAQRETLYARIAAHAEIAVGRRTPEDIDTINILQATMAAMRDAVAGLDHAPAHVLVDGNRLPDASWEATALIKGDARAPSIAAASIVAKVTRDRLMREAHGRFPDYGWDSNKGYGAPAHIRGLEACGITPEHRRSYAPIRAILEQNGGAEI